MKEVKMQGRWRLWTCVSSWVCAVSTAVLMPAWSSADPGASAAPTASVVKTPLGAIVGAVTNAAKLPIGGATITALRTDGGSIRATVTGSDGIYSFADLAAGTWTITVQIEGTPALESAPVLVVASKATRKDIVMPGAAVAADTRSLLVGSDEVARAQKDNE